MHRQSPSQPSHERIDSPLQRHFTQDVINLLAVTVKPDLILIFVRDNEEMKLLASGPTDSRIQYESTTRHHLGECLCGIAAKDGRAVYSTDIHAEPRCTRMECKAAGITSFAALPLQNGEQVIGVLGLASLERRDFAEHCMIIDPLAKAISISLRNALLLEQRDQDEAMIRHLSSFPEQNPNPIIEMDLNGKTIYLNPAAQAVMSRLGLQDPGTFAPDGLAELARDARENGLPIVVQHEVKINELFFNVSTYNLTDQHSVRLYIADVTEQKLAELSLIKTLLFSQALLSNSPMGIRVFDGETGDCVQANQAAADIAGGTVEELLAQNCWKLNSWQQAGLNSLAAKVLADGVARPMEAELQTTFGKLVSARYLFSRFVVEGKPFLLVIGRDATEEKRLEDENRRIEAQILHTQKLESLGILAGGIAHDFNNILTAVLGNADLALKRLAPESPARDNIQRIEQAARQAADLTRQMLAYSGKGHFVVEVLDINQVVTDMTHMLDISISKKVLLRYNLADNLPTIEADATQLRQIIMNLVINASEAIGEQSGVISITTGAMDCDRDYLSKIDIDEQLPEGLYVYLEVSDSGCGMDRDTVTKVFEPFFTTKFTGRGLGMAAVLGIVRGHKGAIKVYSEPGKGTTFKILLPSCGRRQSRHSPPREVGNWQGSGTVLLVDDEETILTLGKEMLQELGFAVLTAEDGNQALDIFKQNMDSIICVVLDLTMPSMDGEQTFRELRQIKPDVRVVISSGYNEQEVVRKFVGKGLAGFIQKPYRLNDLKSKMREVIEAPPIK